MLAMKPLTVIEGPMDTIGKRIKLAMVENDLKQVDILDHFRREGREISKALPPPHRSARIWALFCCPPPKA